VRHATFSLARRGLSAHEKRLKVRELELESSVKNRKHSLVTDAMVLLSKTFHASCSVGLAAAALVAAIPPGRMARAENIIGGADELILALELYLQNPASPPGKSSAAVIELSELLNKLGRLLGHGDTEKFRNVQWRVHEDDEFPSF
jgi:hypothetical protein